MKKIFLLLLTLSSIVATAQEKTINTAISKYDYELAIKLINKEKHSSELDFTKAKCYKNLLKYNIAASILENLASTDSLNTQILMELADCYQLTSNYTKAHNIYSKCIRIQPDNRFFLFGKLSLLYKQKEWSQTIREAKRTFNINSTPELFALIGDCYLQTEKVDSAIYFYKSALLYYPEDYNITVKLAKTYLQSQKYMDMLRCTNDYISIDSTNQAINQYNGISYCFNQQYDKAIYRLSKLYTTGDKSYTTNYFLGVSYFGLQDFYSAYDHLCEAYNKDSTNLNLVYYLGHSAILSGKFAKGTTVLKHGLDILTPKDSVLYNYYSNLALGYSRWGKYEDALENYEHCLNLKPDNKLTIYAIASIYDHNQKNYKLAIKYYDMFLSSFPKNSENNQKELTNELSGTYYSVVKNRVEELKKSELKNTPVYQNQ